MHHTVFLSHYSLDRALDSWKGLTVPEIKQSKDEALGHGEEEEDAQLRN